MTFFLLLPERNRKICYTSAMKKYSIATCFTICAVMMLGASAREADVLRDRLSGCAKNLELSRGCLAGCLLAAGDEAVPLAFGRKNGAKVTVAAATAYGKGRAVAVTHHGFFEKDAGMREENVAFMRESLSWLSGGGAPNVVYMEKGRNAIRGCVERAVAGWKGCRIEQLRGYGELESLPSGSVVVTMPDSHPLADAAKLRAFVSKGGRVLAMVVGWGWQQLNEGMSLCSDNPFNAALGPAGLYAGKAIADGTSGNVFEVAGPKDEPGVSAQSALELAEKGAVDSAQLGATCMLSLDTLVQVLPPDDKELRPRLKAMEESAVSGIVPTPERPFGASNMRERLSYLLFLNSWQANPERNWPASAAAATYPGIPAKAARRVTRDVTVDLSVPRWHGTGLFAVAGEPLTVTLPEGAEKMGLRVRVGSTSCRFTSHAQWKRAPVVDVELPLSKRTVTFASPFGGLVYVVVPYAKAAVKGKAVVKVNVGPACPAPWFVEGRDTPETWVAQLRDSPAPFVEIENDHVVIMVPYEKATKLADPRPLLQVWREIMDNDARLAGISPVRASPERICADVQLCAGYMHSGYPIMMPMDSVSTLLSEPDIRAGENDDVWGFFHEMGHNHQHPDWTFAGTTEVTVNFFTLYNMLKICGRTTRQTKMGKSSLQRSVERWNAKGRPADEWFADPFLALDLFARLADKYGWEAFEKLFAEYARLSPEERPKTDLEKRQQWCRRLSRIVGEDLTPVFQFLLK